MTDYRYTLTRDVGGGLEAREGLLCWVMLNPSTADEEKDDHTIRCVKRFTAAAGYERLVVVNLFAARATQPDELVDMLLAGDDPLGENNGPIAGACIEAADAVVFAWGSSCPPHLRCLAEVMIGFVTSAAAMVGGPLCLGTTKGGQPRHPSRVPADRQLIPWSAP